MTIIIIHLKEEVCIKNIIKDKDPSSLFQMKTAKRREVVKKVELTP